MRSLDEIEHDHERIAQRILSLRGELMLLWLELTKLMEELGGAEAAGVREPRPVQPELLVRLDEKQIPEREQELE